MFVIEEATASAPAAQSIDPKFARADTRLLGFQDGRISRIIHARYTGISSYIVNALKHQISDWSSAIFRGKNPATRSNRLHTVVEKLARPADVTDQELRRLVGYIHLELYNLRAYGQSLHVKATTEALAQEAMRRIRKIVTRRKLQPYRDGALSYVVSYPRSGNTLAMNIMARLGRVQIFSDVSGAVNYIPAECFPPVYPLERIVKAHAVPVYDERCKYVYLVRDGRDILPSIAYMTLGSGPTSHNFTKKHELKDFIDWQGCHYRLGSWVSFTREMLKVAAHDNVLIERYEDLVQSPDSLGRIAAFLGFRYRPERIQECFDERDSIFETIRQQPQSSKKWGLDGATFEQDSLYYAWSKNRAGSSWRETMDAEARRRFHEIGATEILIELGYESDPNWYLN